MKFLHIDNFFLKLLQTRRTVQQVHRPQPKNETRRGTRPASAKVTESIRKGGTGKWGQIPMPAQPALSEADAKTLADWVLSGAK